MRKEIGFVSSRRAEESIAANMAVRENIYLNPVATGKGVVEHRRARAERADTRAALKRFSIKAADPEQPIATLSGGNQQKVVVARWMEAKVKLLVLEEPTIGVDVGSKAEIYHLLQQSLKKGLAVLLISSDFEEVERICHRALVFSRGRVVGGNPARRADDRAPDGQRVRRRGARARGGSATMSDEPTHALSRRRRSPGRSRCGAC